MKRTLVIHPQDESTDFLREIYKGKEWAVLDDPYIDALELKEIIKDFDRIVMLGHGCPEGLFGGFGMIIDHHFIEVLEDKECVCIWCNADQFVEKHDLKGFYSGMFISEVGEASFFGINISQRKVDLSNNLFAYLLNTHIFTEDVLYNMKNEYQLNNHSVVDFNNDRLYIN
ncbi:MAG: hypothetical protein DRQ78_05905 [Epsilonproteobacteria bacterium]|nr:MAG: hypothetical protein DRQ78_05905 [Campylobacterota bacterium]